MNYYGSYKRLFANANAAILAAIEIYNKPSFDYRNECVVILLLNAWELALKALLSKNKKSLFYPKKRKQPYRTLSWPDAFRKAENLLPNSIAALPVKRNLELLGTYRDNAVHFYNASGFSVVIYSLAQTCIINFRDLAEDSFGVKVEEQISWALLPLGLRPPLDAIQYMSGSGADIENQSEAVRHFLGLLATATEEVNNSSDDTGRLLTSSEELA